MRGTPAQPPRCWRMVIISEAHKNASRRDHVAFVHAQPNRGAETKGAARSRRGSAAGQCGPGCHCEEPQRSGNLPDTMWCTSPPPPGAASRLANCAERHRNCFVAALLALATRRYTPPQTSRATSMHRRSFAHCSSSVSRLPSSVLAKPHCGDSASCSSGRYFAASSMRRFSSSLLSSVPSCWSPDRAPPPCVLAARSAGVRIRRHVRCRTP